MERDHLTETELCQTLTDVLHGCPGGVREKALSEAVLAAFAERRMSDAERSGPEVSDTAASVLALLLDVADPFNSDSVATTAALSRVKRELSQWPLRKQAALLDQFTRLLQRRRAHDTEQMEALEQRWLLDNQTLFAPLDHFADDHGYSSVPVIVRGAEDHYVFAGTQVPAAHIIARVPAGDDRAALKARWPTLRDEHIDVAKMLALAHAVGEGRASAQTDEAMDAYLADLRENFDQIHAEIEAWKSLKAEVVRSPMSRRPFLIGRAEAEVRGERELEELFANLDSNPDDTMPALDLLRAKRAQREKAETAKQNTGRIGRSLDLQALIDEEQLIRRLSARDLMARYEVLQDQFATGFDSAGEDDPELLEIEGRMMAVEHEQARRWREENA